MSIKTLVKRAAEALAFFATLAAWVGVFALLAPAAEAEVAQEGDPAWFVEACGQGSTLEVGCARFEAPELAHAGRRIAIRHARFAWADQVVQGTAYEAEFRLSKFNVTWTGTAWVAVFDAVATAERGAIIIDGVEWKP